MKFSNIKNNATEVLNADNLLSLKGGGTTPFNGGGSIINSTNGDESDKRTKRPGTFASMSVLTQAKVK
jgi:hypothetical protein